MTETLNPKLPDEVESEGATEHVDEKENNFVEGEHFTTRPSEEGNDYAVDGEYIGDPELYEEYREQRIKEGNVPAPPPAEEK